MNSIPIPVNVLDKVKYLLNEINAPQYFFQYWEFEGEINSQLIEKAFQKVIYQIDKCNYTLVNTDENYEYVPCSYSKNIVFLDSKQNSYDSVITFMEQKSASVIKDSRFAPVVLVCIKLDGNKTVFLQMINHIFADASSAYMFFETLVKNYNALQQNKQLSTDSFDFYSDKEFLQKLQSELTAKERFLYIFQVIKHIRASLWYKSAKNQITKIYTEQSKNKKVFYDSIILDKDAFDLTEFSVNTVVSSAVLKAFLECKGTDIDNSISVAMPINIRNASCKPFGNYVNSVSIKIENNPSITEIRNQVQSKITEFRNPLRRIASYFLIAKIGETKSKQELLQVFRDLSLKHHCYISNYGLYNATNNPDLYFDSCKLIQAGGFNYPLQANYGIIFTLVPFNNQVSLSVAASPLVISKDEIKTFFSLVQAYL